MGTHCEQLTSEERATIMLMQQSRCSVRAMARTLPRAPSSISRELRRFAAWTNRPAISDSPCPYDARAAAMRTRAQRFKTRRVSKLACDSVLFRVVRHFMAQGWSPSQIAGTLKHMWPDEPQRTVSHETIYKLDAQEGAAAAHQH